MKAVLSSDSVALATVSLLTGVTVRGKVLQLLGLKVQAPNPSFVIDLDDGIVTSSLGEFAITELTPSRISFKAKHGDTAWYGGVDRFSGYAIVTVQRRNEIVTDYKLTCKPAKPLF